MNNGIWFVVAIFVVQLIVSILSKEKPPTRSRRRSAGGAGGAGGASGSQAPLEESTLDQPSGSQSGGGRMSQSPDDIAAEIRRVMGLERESAKVEIIEEHWEDPEPEPVAEVRREPSHGGGLHERMALRDAGGSRSPGHLEERHFDTFRSSIEDRQLTGGSMSSYRSSSPQSLPTRRRHRDVSRTLAATRYVNLDQMASAFVTAEVFGKCKALSDDW